MKKALVTGITGQDGSYLAELLLEKGYEVHGIVRKESFEDPSSRMWRIAHLLDDIQLHRASLDSYSSLFDVFTNVHPDECYHLAAKSYVSYSFEEDFSTVIENLNVTHAVLSSFKKVVPEGRLYFAGSSEIFGNPLETPQNEHTQYSPRSPYGVSKMVGVELVRNYRETYNLFAVSGILFNHESPRRGFEFVTKKISSAAAKIKLGLDDKIVLGNIDALRDWGHSRDYVIAMWMMLQKSLPKDYVIATGKTHSVRDFLEIAFSHVGLDYREYLVINQDFYRPSEDMILCGNASLAKEELSWIPETDFETLVKEMVDHEIKSKMPM